MYDIHTSLFETSSYIPVKI